MRRSRLGVALTVIVPTTMLTGIVLAQLGDLRIVCNNCFKGPADTELVCGEAVECEAGEICVSIARDFDNDGAVDQVDNLCALNPHV